MSARSSFPKKTPERVARANEQHHDSPTIEILGEEYLDDSPISSRIPMVLEADDVTPPPSSDVVVHAPWPIEEMERFAGSRWRFLATVAMLTVLGLVVRDRHEMKRWLSSFAKISKIATARAAGDVKPPPQTGPCPEEMALVETSDTGVRFCVDKYEASLVEIIAERRRARLVAYYHARSTTVTVIVARERDGRRTRRATSARRRRQSACKALGQAPLQAAEWKTACKGPEPKKYGYGERAHAPAPATTTARARSAPSSRPTSRTARRATSDKMNDPHLNQLDGHGSPRPARTTSCTNGYGVYDMVGNLHEWIADPTGTFQGGYYLDVDTERRGCGYRTTAHGAAYHDYSTGFRCCKDDE